MHVDMDYFFAAVEQRERGISGKPVIVGADPKHGKGRGVVSTCNYEARAFGVRSGMPISRAYALCPGAVFLPVNFELYERVSERIMLLLRRHADALEIAGIDEAYLDVSARAKDFDGARRIAEGMQREMLGQEALTCSIGVAPNKLVAKMASDSKKPGGITVVKPEAVRAFLEPLPVCRLPGVGAKTEQALKQQGISTIGQLAAADASALVARFGKMGLWFHQASHGVDESAVTERYEAKSISRESTFDEDTGDAAVAEEALRKLAKEVHASALASGALFKTVGIKVRYADFEEHTAARTLRSHADDYGAIEGNALQLLKPFLGRKKIRKLGVRVANLIKRGEQKTIGEYG